MASGVVFQDISTVPGTLHMAWDILFVVATCVLYAMFVIANEIKQ